MSVLQPVAEGHHLALADVEHALDRVADLLSEQRVLHLVERALGVDLLDQVAELGVLTDGRLERERLTPSHLREVVDLLERRVERLRELLAGGLPAHRLGELEPRPVELAQAVVDVDRQADRAGTIGDRPRDALTDPPRRVGGELEAAAPVEQLNRTHQADVAFLDEIQQRKPLTLVLAGHGNHQPEVGHDEPLARGLSLADVGTSLRDALLRTEAAGTEPIFGLLTALDGHGKLHLFFLGEQRLAGRSLQVEAEIVSVVGP